MSHPAVSPAHLQAAADWYVRLSAAGPGAAEHQAWQAWYEAADEHRAAWQRVERLKALLAQAPEQAGRTLGKAPPRQSGRRGLLAGLAGLGVVGLSAWLYQALPGSEAPVQWLETADGQRRELRLPDGGWLLIGPDSRVGIAYGPRRRDIHLARGALQLESGHDAQGRPLRVLSRDGEARPLGTRFTLVQEAAGSVLAVQADVVELRPVRSEAVWRVAAGERLRFSGDGAQTPTPASLADEAWTRGMVVALEQPLAELLQALQHQSGQRLSCDPALAQRPVSGVFLAQDAQRSLAALAQQQGLRLLRRGAGWHLEAAGAR